MRLRSGCRPFRPARWYVQSVPGPQLCPAVYGRFMSGRAGGWPAHGRCGARPPARLPGAVPCHRTRPLYPEADPRETMPRPAARPPPTCPPGGGAALRAPLKQPCGGGSPPTRRQNGHPPQHDQPAATSRQELRVSGLVLTPPGVRCGPCQGHGQRQRMRTRPLRQG